VQQRRRRDLEDTVAGQRVRALGVDENKKPQIRDALLGRAEALLERIERGQILTHGVLPKWCKHRVGAVNVRTGRDISEA
jgi:hypothetical protein